MGLVYRLASHVRLPLGKRIEPAALQLLVHSLALRLGEVEVQHLLAREALAFEHSVGLRNAELRLRNEVLTLRNRPADARKVRLNVSVFV